MPESDKPILDPNLSFEEREKQAIHLYFELYREGRFYECHDVMEEIWFETDPSRKPFYQGLLQCAVCRHHWENGNRNGAAFLYRKGVQKLLRFCPSYLGVDLDGFLRDLSEVLPRDLVES